MRFFGDHAISSGWASCPLTENAFLRIGGHACKQAWRVLRVLYAINQ
jgi:hypothetical protein